MEKNNKKQFNTFSEFYPFYLSQHTHPTCKMLHFIGTSIVLGMLIGAIVFMSFRVILFAFLVGYGFAWVGHFFFEKNKPATFKYPFYSFIGDWVMWKDVLRGRVRIPIGNKK